VPPGQPGDPIGTAFLTLTSATLKRTKNGNRATGTAVLTSTASAPFRARVVLSYLVTRRVGQRMRTSIITPTFTATIMPGISGEGFGPFGVMGGKSARLKFIGYQAFLA
jgi:hypothetical protein